MIVPFMPERRRLGQRHSINFGRSSGLCSTSLRRGASGANCQRTSHHTRPCRVVATGSLIDYGERHRSKKPISTSWAEGSVDEIANARMAKEQRMRCSPQGTHRMAVVRGAARRWMAD